MIPAIPLPETHTIIVIPMEAITTQTEMEAPITIPAPEAPLIPHQVEMFPRSNRKAESSLVLWIGHVFQSRHFWGESR